MSTFYEILDINKTASKDEIKKAFKKMAVKYHPDKNLGNPHSEEKFKQVNQAYQILKDPIKRRAYDQRLAYLEFMIRNRTAQNTNTTSTTARPTAYTRNPYQSPNHQTTYTNTYTAYNPRQRTRKGPAQQRSTQKEDKIFITQLSVFIALFFGIALYVYFSIHNEIEPEQTQTTWGEVAGHNALILDIENYIVNKNYVYAHESLKKLQLNYPYGSETSTMPKKLAKSIWNSASKAMENNDYNKTIIYLSLLQEFNLIRDSGLKVEEYNKLYFKAAFNNSEEKEAIKSLLYITTDSIDLYKAYALIGETYIEREQYKAAYPYLKKSISIISNNYVKRYGDIYYMLDMFRIPDIHYGIFCNKALAEIQLNKMEDAEQTLRFIENNRPAEAKAFHLHSKLEKKLNNPELSCLLFQKAQERDSLLVDELLSNYCL